MITARANGVQVFLSGDEKPAFSYSAEGFDDPTKLKGGSSTTIRIAHTNEAARALGGEGMGERNANRPLLVLSDGSNDIVRANFILEKISRDLFEGFTLEGNATWFDYAKRTKLKDVDLGLSAQLTYSLITQSWVNPNLLYFPLVDFGSFEDRDETYEVPITAMRPGFRISELLNRMMEPHGYYFSPKGRLARHWKNFIVFQPTDKVRCQTISGGGGAASLNVEPDQYELTQFGEEPEPLYSFTPIVGDNWDGSNFWYTMPHDGTLVVRASFRIQNYDDPGYDGLQYRISVWDVTDGKELSRFDTDPIVYTDGGHVDVRVRFPAKALLEGHRIKVGISISGPVTQTLVEVVTIPDEFNLLLFLCDTEYTLNIPIIQNTALPDMTVMELLKGIMLDQRLSVRTNNDTGEIGIWYSDEYYRTGNATRRDLRNRIDTTVAPVKEYPAKPTKMLFRFKEDNGDRMLLRYGRILQGPGYGNADHDPDGWTNEETVSLPFAPTAMGTALGDIFIPIMRDDSNERIDDAEDPNDGFFADKYNRQCRLLYADGVTDFSWTLGASDPGYYPRCYFTEPRADSYPIAFGNADIHGIETPPGTVAANWKRTLRRMKDGRIMECYVMLQDHEVKDFDHGQPTIVPDSNGMFTGYVMEIVQHQPGERRPTKVRVLEMDSNAIPDFIPSGAITYPGTNPVPQFSWDDDGAGGDEWDDDGSGTDELIDQ